MRCLKCKSLFVSVAVILTSLFVTFAINSTQASAAQLTTNVSATGRSWPVGSNGRCVFVDNNGNKVVVNANGYGICTAPSAGLPLALINVYSTNLISTVTGRYYESYFAVIQDGDFASTSPHQSMVSRTIATDNYVWILNDFSEVTKDQFWTTCNTYSATNSQATSYECSNTAFSKLGSSASYYKFSLSPLYTANNSRFQLGTNYIADNPVVLAYVWPGSQIYLGRVFEFAPTSNSDVTNAINSQSQQQHQDSQAEINSQNATTDAIEEQNQKDDQDRSNMSSQQDSADSDSDASQQAAESTGTTLLAAFSSFVTAITSASPTNCKIDMDMGNFDLGLVDFCQLSPPPAFQTLSSIFLILFCVPLSIATARKVINLFRSFQG